MEARDPKWVGRAVSLLEAVGWNSFPFFSYILEAACFSCLLVPHYSDLCFHYPIAFPDPDLFSSVQFSCSVVSGSLRLHGLQHTRLPGPSSTPGVYLNSSPLSWWCHPTISSSVVPFSCLQSFPASGSFPVSQFFAWCGQSIGVSASATALPMNIQDWLISFRDWLVGSPCSPRDSKNLPSYKGSCDCLELIWVI